MVNVPRNTGLSTDEQCEQWRFVTGDKDMDGNMRSPVGDGYEALEKFDENFGANIEVCLPIQYHMDWVH